MQCNTLSFELPTKSEPRAYAICIVSKTTLDQRFNSFRYKPIKYTHLLLHSSLAQRERGGAGPQLDRGHGEEEARDGRGGGQGVLLGLGGGEQVSEHEQLIINSRDMK